MWNRYRSLWLSKVCVLLFALALLLALIFAPALLRWLFGYSQNAEFVYAPYFYATLYTGGVMAFFLLYQLFRLLQNMGREQVFIHRNVAYMRRISWSCFAGGLICLVSAFYYVPWVIVAVAAGFVGLVVRVFKNVLAEAILLKEENDYTI